MYDYPPIPQELPPEPERYHPEYFSGRQRELEWIQRKVKEGLSGYPITQPVVHVWGLRGVGKSWLLCHLRGQYRFPGLPGAVRKHTFCALADFATLRFSQWEPQTAADLLENLATQIQEQLGEKAAVGEGKGRFEDELTAVRGDRNKEATDLAERFVQWVNRLSNQFVFLLLLDAVETLSGSDLVWLESHLIEPLARTDRAIIVVAGRKEIPRWREFGVRQRLVVWELKPFSPEETREQLKQRGYDRPDLAAVVHSLSFGLPYANQVLSAALAQLAGEQPLGADFEEVHRSEVLTLLGQIEGELLRDLRSEEHRKVLHTLSVLRRFNIEAARAIFSTLLDEKYEEQGDAAYLRLFEDLEATNLVWWSMERRGYIMGAPLRRMMDQRVQIDNPDAFVHRHQKALQLYEEWTEKYPREIWLFLPEALYHLVNSKFRDPEEQICEAMDALLDRSLCREIDSDSADALFQSLYRDDELPQVMPAPVHDHLLQRVRQFRDELVEGSHPPPYRPEEFVARKAEVEMVRDRIVKVCHGEGAGISAIHFYGTPTIGKSWLLKHLARLGQNSSLSEPACKLITLFVDCEVAARSVDAPKALFRALRESMEQAQDYRQEVPQDITTLAKILCGDLSSVYLLLFDAADALSAEDFGWLEEHLLEPLVREGRAVIVVSGREDTPQWRGYETRRRLSRHALDGFTIEEVADLVRSLGSGAEATEIYHLSGGHPYAAWRLAKAPSLEDAVIAQKLEPVAEQLLRNVPEKLKDTMKVLTALRRFINIAALRFFFGQLMGEEYERRPDAFYFDFLNKTLGERDLLIRDRASGQYYFAPAVRAVLQQHLRLTRTEEYQKGHQIALDLYGHRLESLPLERPWWLAEYLYHAAIVSPRSLTELYEDLIKQHGRLSTDQASELRRLLGEDQDLNTLRHEQVEALIACLSQQGG